MTIQIIEQSFCTAILEETHSATAARQLLAHTAVLCANHFCGGELVEAGARRLADQPAGHYRNPATGGDGRTIEKLSPHCYVVHCHTESIPVAVTYHARLKGV